jgi:N-methylhydantoinase A/oxoprolinase/acetone carboxylase beta subunit
MEAEGRRIVRGAGVADREVKVRRSAEMRYLGQGHEVEVEIPEGPLGPGSLEAITAAFEAAYRLLYSRTPQGVPLEALNWRAVVSGPRPEFPGAGASRPAPADAGGGAAAGPPKGRRPAYFPGGSGFVDTPVYDRYALAPGSRLSGPAIVEERESTTVIGPRAVMTVDEHRTLIAEPASGETR